MGSIQPAQFELGIVDTIVQEKTVAHPLDSRLLKVSRMALVKAAKGVGIALKQTFAREGKAGGYACARPHKRLRKVVKRQRTMVGRLLRENDRKLPGLSQAAQDKLKDLMARWWGRYSLCQQSS